VAFGCWVERDRDIILDHDYVGYGLGNKEFILFPCLDVRDWVWEIIEQMTEVPFSYMYQFFWYEGSFVILDIISQASHHKSITHPST
jgi:hypothetical protein